MTTQNATNYLSYWDENIEKWGELYLEQSHAFEDFNAPRWLNWVYKKTIYKLEARLMKHRYAITMKFISDYVKPGMRFNDIGCGTGVFTIAALQRGALVNAIDFSEKALEITQQRILKHVPDFIENAKFYHLDAAQEPLPKAEISIAMGVTPYISDLASFYKNILTNTDTFYCLLTDSENLMNKLRGKLPFLNVRRLIFYNRAQVNELINLYHFKLLSRTKFATGFIDLYQK